MLHGVYITQDSILSEKDPLTGKQKKEMFLEVYFLLLKKIKSFFYEPTWKIRSTVINNENDSITETDIIDSGVKEFNEVINTIYKSALYYYKDNNVHKMNSEILNIRSILKNIRGPLTIKEYEGIKITDTDIEEIFTNLYDIHPLSTIVELSRKHKNFGINYITDENRILDRFLDKDNNAYTRANYRFPRNVITEEAIYTTKLYEPVLYSSIESFDEALSNEDSILASNGNYSFIGGLGGSVTDQEELNDKASLEGDSKVEFNSNESFDGLERKSHNKEVENIIFKWNNLFKKHILNDIEIKLPK
jgi:hypothetical protein